MHVKFVNNLRVAAPVSLQRSTLRLDSLTAAPLCATQLYHVVKCCEIFYFKNNELRNPLGILPPQPNTSLFSNPERLPLYCRAFSDVCTGGFQTEARTRAGIQPISGHSLSLPFRRYEIGIRRKRWPKASRTARAGLATLPARQT